MVALEKNYKALSLYRFVFGSYLLCDYVINLLHFYPDFYGDKGLLPIELALETHSGWQGALSRQFIAAVSTIADPAVFSVAYLGAVLFFCLGIRTFAANLVVFLLHFYLFVRNPLILAGSDELTHLMLLWSLFLPLNRYWSVDAALETGERDRFHPLFPFLAIRIQVCSVYLFAALSKLVGAPWREGYALVWVLNDNAFGATDLGLFLAETFPGLLFGANYLVITFQLAFTLLVFSPFHASLMRLVALGGAAAMHLSFIFCLNIGSFPYLSLVVLLVFVPDEWIERVTRRRGRLEQTIIFFEPGCEFCRKMALLLREFLLPAAAKVCPASDDPEMLQLLRQHESWVVRGANGALYLKWDAVAHLLSQNPVTYAIAFLMSRRPLRRPLEWVYDLIGRKRRTLGAITRWVLPFRREQMLSKWGTAVCVVIALLGLASNAHSTVRLAEADENKFQASRASVVLKLARIVQVTQQWHLFAPVPVHFNWSFQIAVVTSDGASRDLMPLLPIPLFTMTPDGGKVRFANSRWLKYFEGLHRFNVQQINAFGTFLCRKAGEQRSLKNEKSYQIEMVSRLQDIDYRAVNTNVRLLKRRFNCGS